MPDQFGTIHNNAGDEFAVSQELRVTARQVAHDCNNLLAIISSCTLFLLEGETLSRNANESLSDIADAAGRAAELLRQLLPVPREHAPPDDPPLDVSARVYSLARLLRRIAGPRVDLTTGCDANLISRISDVQFDRILINLVKNARAATPDGGAIQVTAASARISDLHICTEGWLQAGDYIRLTVSDTGCGMPPEVQARIFEPFYTTRAQVGGTGVGLSTVQDIVRQHRGAIDVSSAPSAGTTFEIYLPAAGSAAGEVRHAA